MNIVSAAEHSAIAWNDARRRFRKLTKDVVDIRDDFINLVDDRLSLGQIDNDCFRPGRSRNLGEFGNALQSCTDPIHVRDIRDGWLGQQEPSLERNTK